MAIKDKEAYRTYINEYRKRKRRERGLQKKGRKPSTPEQVILSNENRKEWERKWSSQYRTVNPIKRMLFTARRRAKVKEQEFTIEEKDIIIPEVCPYLKIPMQSSAKRGDPRKATMSLDRIDSTKGYVPGNVEVISWLANTMKSNASKEDLVSFAKEVLKRYDKCID
jgi:hypothetical protein